MHYPGEKIHEAVSAQFMKKVTQSSITVPRWWKRTHSHSCGAGGCGRLKLSWVLATGCSHAGLGHPSDTSWSPGRPTQERILSIVQVLEGPRVSLFCQWLMCATPVTTSSPASCTSVMHSPEQEANLATVITWLCHGLTSSRISATSSTRELHPLLCTFLPLLGLMEETPVRSSLKPHHLWSKQYVTEKPLEGSELKAALEVYDQWGAETWQWSLSL